MNEKTELSDEQILALYDQHRPLDDGTEAIAFARAVLAASPSSKSTKEARPLFDPMLPEQGYVSDAEWAARKAAKADTADARLRQVLDIVMRWLVPDGISSGSAMVEISKLVDPMPLASSSIKEDGERAVNPPEFQEATWGVDSVMRPCKSMAISEYAFRQWAKDVGIVLASPPSPLGDTPDQQEQKR